MKCRNNSASGRITISNYSSVIKQFLPFVLVRCAKYTTRGCLAEIIAIYVFICVYYLSERLTSPTQIVAAIEIMVDIVGSDLADGSAADVGGGLYGVGYSSVASDYERAQRVIESVMDYLAIQN